MSISDDGTAALGAPRAAGPGLLAVHRFARPAGIRRLQTVTALTAVALCAALALWVWLDDGAAVGSLILMLALTAALWVAWFGQPDGEVRVEYGALVVTSGEKEQRLDIAAAELDVVGAPGQRGWRVRFRRSGRRALVVDATMVDPDEFTQVLARWRPDLGAPPAARPEVAPDAR